MILGGLAAGIVGTAMATAGEVFQIDLRRRWTTEIDLPPVCFYVSAQSVTAGDDLEVAHHCEGDATLTISRMGADGSIGMPVDQRQLSPTMQSGTYDFWRGFDWSTKAIPTSDEWPSGLYLLELQGPSGPPYRQCVVIRPTQMPDVAVVLSTNTWAAYNDFGGLSNYRDSVTPQPLRLIKRAMKVLNWRLTVGNRRSVPALPLPFHRPNDAVNIDLVELEADAVEDPSHLVRAEWAALRYLDQIGNAHHPAVESKGWTYGVYSDHDVAFGVGPDRARLTIFTAHSEYWSEEMKARFTAYLQGGGRALFLSGNHWYRTVKFLEHGLEVIDDRVDPVDVAATLGAGYTADGYETYAPYRVVKQDHPIFEGTGLADGAQFAGPDRQGRGGSGYETDKVNTGSGQTEVLAIGDNPEGPAFLVWKSHDKGGWVCNFGSVACAPWVERCEAMASVVKNAIALGLRSDPDQAAGDSSA